MERNVTVRMYNVGFGDSFLLQFPNGDRPYRILIDCGSHTHGYGPYTPTQVAECIIQDVSNDNGEAAIDVVVASHRHRDHIAGFASPTWRHVKATEVWMPWTEDPGDQRARQLRAYQSRLAVGLDRALADNRTRMRYGRPRQQQLAALQHLVENSLTNDQAMATLHGGFRGNPTRRYLSCDDRPPFTPTGAPEDLIVHVLGPSKSLETIRDLDPPSSQSYLRFAAIGQQQETTEAPGAPPHDAHRPFRAPFTIDAREFERRVRDGEPGYGHLQLKRTIKGSIRQVTRDDDLAAAATLDRAINGTSLMLLFEFGDAVLLFPGDAQWGSWKQALDDPARRSLMERTTFYKVGHHGSHNATPKQFVHEVLADKKKLWAASISVKPIGQWRFIPKAELVETLEQLTPRIVRSDTPPEQLDGVRVDGDRSVEFKLQC